MTQIVQPSTTVNIIGANVAASNTAKRALIVGQMTAAGTATAGALNSAVDSDDVAGLFGAGSMIEDAFTAFREVNEITPIDVIALDDPAGTAAEGNILFDGTATAAGEFEIGIGSSRNGVATVTVDVGDDGDDVATAIAAAFATLTSCVCAVAVDGDTTDQVNITYNHVGVEGNYVPFYISGSVPGITYTLTAMTGGTGTPTLTTVFDVVGNRREHAVISPISYGVTYLTTFLDARWNVSNRVLDGVAFVTASDSKADHVSALGSINSQCICYGCEKEESRASYKGPAVFENLLARSAMVAALSTLRLTTNANIAAYVNAAGGPNDTIGGPAIASLPYFNSPLPLPVMEDAYGWTDTEIEEIVAAGGYVVGANTAGTDMILGEVTTTYKTDTGGNADTSFKYLCYRDTISEAREYMFNNFKADCAQARLTEGDLMPGRNMHNEASITGLAMQYYGVLSGPDYCLLQAGEDARNYFAQNLSVSLNMNTGMVTITMKAPIITQLRTIWANLQIAFSVNG